MVSHYVLLLPTPNSQRYQKITPPKKMSSVQTEEPIPMDEVKVRKVMEKKRKTLVNDRLKLLKLIQTHPDL